MRGTISKIHPLKRSVNGNFFRRVEFKLEDGSWAATDLCPDFRNYARWKDFLVEGTQLEGLELKGKSKVNADSFVTKFNNIQGYWKQGPNGGMMFVTQ